ncbi:hypothetical protein [Brucella sp. BE17]|uniref:hypothetical protein n=1 Tax=Brucella/Ochrobactrum group TaxID=2826938 RepID=UPI0015FD8E0E|nr:hypothetical protein [Ochrobactrum sp. RH2CCR150]
MSISPRITNKVIEGLRVQLREAADATPGPQWMSQMDVIRELQDEISSLQAKGFPLKAITEILAKRGVQMTPAKLSTYLSRVRQEKSKTL